MGKKIVRPVYDHAPVIKRIKELLVENISDSKIAKILNEEGFVRMRPNHPRNTWTPVWCAYSLKYYKHKYCDVAEGIENPFGGRPRAIKKEDHEKILGWIRLFVTQDDICMRLDITSATWTANLAYDPEFAEKVREAMGQGRDNLVDKLVEHSNRDPKSAQWLLERKHKKEFLKQDGKYTATDFLHFAMAVVELNKDYIAPNRQAEYNKAIEKLIKDIESSKE